MRRELAYLLLGGLVLAAVPTGGARADLVSWWRFDEGSGPVVVDSSRNGNDGVLEGGTERVAGWLDDAIQFNGSDAFARAPYIPLNNRSFTVTMWVKPILYTGEQVVFSQRQRSAPNTDLHFRLGGPGGGDAPAGGVRMGFYDNDLNTRAGIIRNNTWYHLTFWYDFENQDRRIYINGTQEARGKATAYLGTSGDTVIGSWAGSSQWFRGIIDDVQVYSHALTDAEIQSAMGGFAGYPFASEPDPADGALHPYTRVALSWRAGDSGVSHDVYLGDNADDVSEGTGDTFRGNQTGTSYVAGLPESAYPDGLVRGTTYYWRIDEVEVDGVTTHKGKVWSFFVASGKACDPVPGDGETSVAADVTLTWRAGLGAGQHTVYFGDDPEMVENAPGGTPQRLTRYYPGVLELDKTYYWRVDEFDGVTTYRGNVWSFTTAPADASWGATYYVDGGNGAARDTHPGSEALPFKTIGRGVQSLQPGDALFIKAGTYRETVILARSGTKVAPIRIWADPGDEGRVIINAAEPVTNWQKCAGPADCAGNPNWSHIYCADVAHLVESHPDAAFAVRQVFQDGELLNRSRYPSAGWSYPTPIVDPGTTFSDRGLSLREGYFSSSVCHVKTAVWQIDQIPIEGFSQGTVTLARSPRYAISPRFGYYITNIVGEINQEGQWAYDPALQRLFIWPKNDVAEDIEVTYRDYCLRTYAGVSSVHVRGLVLQNAYRYGIWVCRADDVRIEDNTVEHAYEHGIYVEGWGGRCDNAQIVNNTVRHACCYGIVVDGDSYNSNVQGNYVYGSGAEDFADDLMNGRGEGILVGGPSARVYHNRIDRTGHTGLYLSGGAGDREVSYNHITHSCLSLSDSGGIYAAGFADGPQEDWIHHNIIEDIVGCLSMDRHYDMGSPPTVETHSGDAPGIYIDEEGNHRIIEHNTVIRSHMTGIYFHWAPSNLVKCNRLYGNRESQIRFDGKNEPRKILVDDALLDNVMFATDAQQKTFHLGIEYDDVAFGVSDDNCFYNPCHDRHILVSWHTAGGGGWASSALTLDGWRGLSGYDGNSREFSYLDRFSDLAIDPEGTSRIIYNASLDAVSVDLGSQTYCDVQGNKIYGTVSLPPFESKILISCDFEIPDPPSPESW